MNDRERGTHEKIVCTSNALVYRIIYDIGLAVPSSLKL